jgi:hypothetical protein
MRHCLKCTWNKSMTLQASKMLVAVSSKVQK